MDRYYIDGQPLKPELLDENTSWSDTVETLLNELGEAGVSNEYTQIMACFLYAAYRNRQPLLLAGPHGSIIADAFSVSLFGKTAGILDCSEPFSRDALKRAEESEDQVIIIKNAFRDPWMASIMELMQDAKKQYFVVHPFVEDLAIEPQSIYNYTFPVITEVLVDHFAGKNFVGGMMAQSYTEHSSVEAAPDGLLRKLRMGKFAAVRLQHVLADTQDMLATESKDVAFLLAYFPYAYVTGQISLLEDMQAISKNTRDCIKGFIGDV